MNYIYLAFSKTQVYGSRAIIQKYYPNIHIS